MDKNSTDRGRWKMPIVTFITLLVASKPLATFASTPDQSQTQAESAVPSGYEKVCWKESVMPTGKCSATDPVKGFSFDCQHNLLTQAKKMTKCKLVKKDHSTVEK